MISSKRIAAAVVIYVLLNGLVGGDPNTFVVKKVCTLRHYEYSGGYDSCVPYVSYEIIAMTAKNGYSYSVDGRSMDEFSGKCFGHAACNGKLSPSDCRSCLDYALYFMTEYCTNSVGAQIKFEDCRIRYEDYSFDPDY